MSSYNSEFGNHEEKAEQLNSDVFDKIKAINDSINRSNDSLDKVDQMNNDVEDKFKDIRDKINTTNDKIEDCFRKMNDRLDKLEDEFIKMKNAMKGEFDKLEKHV